MKPQFRPTIQSGSNHDSSSRWILKQDTNNATKQVTLFLVVPRKDFFFLLVMPQEVKENRKLGGDIISLVAKRSLSLDGA